MNKQKQKLKREKKTNNNNNSKIFSHLNFLSEEKMYQANANGSYDMHNLIRYNEIEMKTKLIFFGCFFWQRIKSHTYL